MTISDFKKEFDDIFIRELHTLIRQANSVVSEDITKQYLEYIVTIASSGKRIRPYNTALTYTIYCGKDWRAIKNTLVGIELIHLMALIHDDVMDESDTRHDVSSIHAHIYNSIQGKASDTITHHVSNSLAILVGDMLFAWAYASFSKDTPSTESWTIIHELVEEVILGQMMDVYNPLEERASIEAIEKKMLLKTARYTFTRPLLLGTTYTNIPKEQTLWITQFGDSVGLLFQMQDDIFDITKSAEEIHKNPLGDIKNGIHTLLSTYAVEKANTEERKLWTTWFGNKNITNQEEIKSFLTFLGVFAFGESYIKEKESMALQALSESQLRDDHIQSMKVLLSIITRRTY